MAPKKTKSKKTKPKPIKNKAKARPVTRAKAKAPKAAAKSTPAIPKDLQKRLAALAVQMDKSMDAVMLQALCEFADAWEDHFRNIRSLQDDDDRIVLSVTSD